MTKKYLVAIGICLSIILLYIATIKYPGGSFIDKNSIGFDWTKNFFSNLFSVKAINGATNSGRYFAYVGIVIHSLANVLFFVHMSKKVPLPKVAFIIKSLGVLNMFFSVMIATPYHDIMVVLSSASFLAGLFYITFFIFKTKLHWLKLLCLLSFGTFYYTLFLYGAGNWGLLAIMQKVTFAVSNILILSLEYFTKAEDFAKV
jgi:hypothetical protein